MEIETIFRLLNNSGFRNLSTDNVNIYMEDPACIVRSFETFLGYAWTILVFITGIMLAGWAWMMIRGSKNAQTESLTHNIKSLVLIFGTLSIVPAIVNFIYGDNLIGAGCKTISVPLDQVNALLAKRKEELDKYDAYNLYENFDIYDSGITIPETLDTDTVPTAKDDTDGLHMTYISDTSQNVASGSVSANMTPVRAIASGNDVIYVAADNQQYQHVGGTRAWRNNNPGNLRMYDFARRAGAIGEAGGFAVFPDPETGRQAIKRLLQTQSYKNLTVAGAISRYAPPSENNTAAYHRSIEKLTGLSINRRMNELNDAELDSVVSAITQIEGWKPGKVVKVN